MVITVSRYGGVTPIECVDVGDKIRVYTTYKDLVVITEGEVANIEYMGRGRVMTSPSGAVIASHKTDEKKPKCIITRKKG